jgi:RNA polymerase nonessential primary-like sigma factor
MTNGKSPTTEELAEALGMKPAKVRETLDVVDQRVLSLDQTYENDTTLDNLIATECDTGHPAEQTELREALINALNLLSEEERTAVVMRFGLQDGVVRPFKEIGETLGITPTQGTYIVRKALCKLKESGELEHYQV